MPGPQAKPSAAGRRFRVEIGSGFILLFALIYFFDEDGLLASLIPCMVLHELGHVSAMLFFGVHPTRLKLTAAGLSLDYSGDINAGREMLTALAGPVFGFAFSLFCARLGRLFGNEYLLMCSGLGFILNTFNLLPAKSLDGGHILDFLLNKRFDSRKAERVFRSVTLSTVLLLLSAGMYFIAIGRGFALFSAGIMLFVLRDKRYCK